MRLGDVAQLPTVLRAEAVADIWDMSTDSVYQGARDGTLPVAPLSFGRSYRWPTVAVLKSVGIYPNEAL